MGMAWIDYRKAYDMVPHSWIHECIEMFGIAKNVERFLKDSMTRWRTELTACGEALGEVRIKRGIFQGDSLSPLLFVLCMVPLTLLLRKVKAGYEFKRKKVKVNHILFMDDLKLYGKNEEQVSSLVNTVYLFSKDIGMEFGLKKCGVLMMRRGKVQKSEGIELPSGEAMKEIEEGGYKYLGILEMDDIMEEEMRGKFKKEYLRRLRLVLGSKLSGRNKIMAVNTWAIALLRYGAGIVKWSQEKVQTLDRKTRKLLTLYGVFHPKSDVDRLYLPRAKGGRGLISCEMCIRSEENNLGWYVKKSVEPMLVQVRENGVLRTEGCVKKRTIRAIRRKRRKKDGKTRQCMASSIEN